MLQRTTIMTLLRIRWIHPTSGVETTRGRGGSRQQAGVSRWCTELRGLSINVLGVIRVMWGSKQSSLPRRSHVRGVLHVAQVVKPGYPQIDQCFKPSPRCEMTSVCWSKERERAPM